MTAVRRRPAFDPDALSDIDELLPVMPPVPDVTPDGVVPGSPELKQVMSRDAGGGTQGPPQEQAADLQIVEPPVLAPTASVRPKPPEVALAPAVYSALRDTTLSERAASPTTARSYGRVALDAIEAQADELKARWRPERQASGGLFVRTDGASQRRRRHSEAPARVPLAGIVASDVAQLDLLAQQWGAGSRSALVEEALRMYLSVGDDGTPGHGERA